MNEQAQKSRRKPGPVAGPERRQFTVLIDPDLGEWAKNQPGGLSELVRRLLHEARAAAGSRDKSVRA